MSSQLIAPHGGNLNPLLIDDASLKSEIRKAGEYPVIRMNSRETSDLIMLAMGAFSPLRGFMNKLDYTSVVSEMHMSDGLLWPIPVTLSVDKELADTLPAGSCAALVDDESNELMGSIQIEDKYTYDKILESKNVYLTTDPSHPGVLKTLSQKEVCLGGPVQVFHESVYPEIFGNYYARPSEIRIIFKEKGWQTIACFQTRNPIHRSHEYVTKIALETCDGLLIHPLVGRLKPDDIPAEIRMKCYEVLLKNYYPQNNTLLRVYPMEMRYAGPREALLHAIIRQNFGCTHILIGRDHAGVGNFYGSFDAQKIFEQIPKDKLLIKPINIDWTFWCFKCGGMASDKTCPHTPENRLLISGTKLREMLSRGEKPPAEFSRPEVVEILLNYYKNLSDKRQ